MSSVDELFDEFIPEWKDCSPQFVLLELFKLGDPEKGKNIKGFWKTYDKNWTKLNADKQNKCRAFFQNLDASTKATILAKAVAATNTDKLQDASKASETVRKKPTTKDEVSRVIHLVKAPEAAVHWGRIQNPMTRRALDSRNSSDAPAAGGVQSMADESNGWIGLLEIFNDPEVKFENLAVQYHSNGTKKSPWRARSDAIQAIAAITHDIDPNNFNQRDVGWLKDVYCKIKAGLTKIYSAYNVSGKQDGGDDAENDFKSEIESVFTKQCTAWASMSGNVTKGAWPDAMAYAFVVLNEDDFNHVVRLLGSVGRDGESKKDVEDERRKRRKLSKDKKHSAAASVGAGLGAIIAEEGRKEDKRAYLSLIMQYGSEAEKAKAMAAILKGAEDAEKNISSSSSSSSAASTSCSLASSGGANESFVSDMGRGDDD